jgi:hypothetical protein
MANLKVKIAPKEGQHPQAQLLHIGDHPASWVLTQKRARPKPRPAKFGEI